MNNMRGCTTSNQISCGLDFGTSNSVISLTDKATCKEIFSYSANSILYFPEGNDFDCFVGKEAQEKYVEEGMRGRLLKSVKTLLRQDNFLYTWIGGRKVTPDQLVTYIISHLKAKAEEFCGKEITEVVLGRPAVFSEDPQKEKIAVDRLLLAARNAGFRDITLQLEPIAAAFAYESTLDHPQNVLVADFGGGTSDFTIIHLSPEKVGLSNREEDILGHDGVYIGGDLFDSEIMWHKITPHLGRGVMYKDYNKEVAIPTTLFWDLRNWEKSFLLKNSKNRRMMDKFYVFSGNNARIDNVRRLIDHNYVYSLFKIIEQAKIELSKQPESEINFDKLAVEIHDTFRYEEFEEMITKHMSDIERCILQLLHTVGYDASQIDSVFLTGGSSLALPVQKLLGSIFGEGKIQQGNTFNSVAQGLSLSGGEK
ncbi:MAG: Hsp70 family protein [Bacteroidales bacterium]